MAEIKKKLDDAGIALSALGTPLGKIGIEDPFEKHFDEKPTFSGRLLKILIQYIV